MNTRLLIFTLISLLANRTLGQTTTDSIKATSKITPLFREEELIKLNLATHIKALLKDRGDSPKTHWGTLTYQRKKKEPLTLPVKVSVRGNFRKNPQNCIFPPLLIDFNKRKKKNSIFNDQNKLKLVTHCRVPEYVEREYLVYKVYNLLTDYSFRARLAQVTYTDSAAARKPETYFGFMIEDESDLAKRNNAKLYKVKQLNMGRTDSVSMAMVSVFQYMIGNTDWSVPFMHNIKLLAIPDKAPLPVPYDFDHAGIVEANYAHPPEILELTSVRERLYRGLTYSPEVFTKVFARFKTVKPQIYALYANHPTLNKAYVKRTLKYLDDFYEIIDDPKSLKKVFIYGGGKKINAVIRGL